MKTHARIGADAIDEAIRSVLQMVRQQPPHPASAPRKILVSTPATARNREFIKYLPKGIVSNTLV